MLFLTCDPYADNIEPTGNECFICYEYILDSKYSKKMSNIFEYCKSCDCDVYVHTVCLNKWFDIYKNCPICRKTITKNYRCVTRLMSPNNIFNFIFNFVVKYYVGISQICYVLFFVFLLYEKVNENIANRIYYYQESYYIDDNIFINIKNKTNQLLH
jgi:hypothetical protein